MSLNDENDELLNLALKASLEEYDEHEEHEDNEHEDNDDKDEHDTIINSDHIGNDDGNDSNIKKAIEASLLENNKHNEELFNSVIYESLETLDVDEQILEKVIKESQLSNISIRLNNEVINSGSSSGSASDIVSDSLDELDMSSYNNSFNDLTEEEYMKMIIQQITESEEMENKLKINKQKKSIIEEQDFEYEESLKKDIEKDIEKENSKNKTPILIPILTPIQKTIHSDEPEIPKTNEELRKIRLAFFDKK